MCWRKCRNKMQVILGICRRVHSGGDNKLVKIRGARQVDRGGSCSCTVNGILEEVVSEGVSQYNWKSSGEL